MSAEYQAVLWNPQKKRYDSIMAGLMFLYLALFIGVSWFVYPNITGETLVIRAAGTLAIIMLHVILIIGPLCRLYPKFLPLLYNRRHLGVATFIVAAVHGIFSLLQFHSAGDTNMFVSLFTANKHYFSVANFPFQTLGFFSLVILFVMAATSHDFWLKNLSPKIWKMLHMSVYLAYAMLIMHVMLGIVQLEQSLILIGLLGLGMMLVIGLHMMASWKQRHLGRLVKHLKNNGFVRVCTIEEIPNNRAKFAKINGESIAIFKYDNKLSAINNFCKHQNGPLSEGKFVDGCITCPWHGYQYLPENGSSPPPFTEQVSTYHLHLEGNVVWVNPTPEPEGTHIEPVVFG